MSDATEVQNNAFNVMMQASGAPSKKPAAEKDDNDPIVTAVIYRRWLEHVDKAEPLWHVPYFGQAVRVGETPQAVAEARWYEEDNKAKRVDKELGLLAVLDCFGKDAMDDKVLEHRTGPRSVVQAWADQREKELIAEAGGMLRDMDKRLKQTLNLTAGGKGAAWWASMDAFRARCFNRFKTEMEAYVEEFGTSLVPRAYDNPLTGYKLGITLGSFRYGVLRKGMPNQKEIEAWAESLPHWAWNCLDACFDRFKAEMTAYAEEFGTSLVPRPYVNPLTGCKLGDSLHNFRKGVMRKGSPNQKEIEAWAESLPKWAWNAIESQDWTDSCRERGRAQWANADEATREKWRASQNAAHNEPEYLEKAAERGRQQFSSAESREELAKRSRAQWANADEETKAEWTKKQQAPIIAKQQARLALMTPKERKAAEKKIASEARKRAKKKADLLLLRTIEPHANEKDLPRARRDGILAKAVAKAKADKAIGAGSSSDPKRASKKQRVTYDSSDESSLGDGSDEE